MPELKKTTATPAYAIRLTRADLAFISECMAQNGNDRSAAEKRAFAKINRTLMKADRAEQGAS